MAILDRVKKRVETDLDDVELQLLIDEANQAVISRCGAHPDPSEPLVEWVDGNVDEIVVDRPIDTTQTVAIVEYVTSLGWGETPVTLVAADYRIWPGSRIIQRLQTGPNSSWGRWADRVMITYTPVNDGDQREEVIIKLVILSLQYDGVSLKTIGDVSANNLDYVAEREKLLSSLQPSKGLKIA